MKRILMILTSHRLDCLKLAIDLLKQDNSFEKFAGVVLLLNGVAGRHLKYVRDLMASMPHVAWDAIAGPRGKGALVANLQNECVRRYPDSLYFKIDEDVFVSPGWVEKMTQAYDASRTEENLALLTPVIPNNGLGFHHLLNRFPELMTEYKETFVSPVVPDCNGPVWVYPNIAKWLTRKFLNLESANRTLENGKASLLIRFAFRFSINCLVYDYRHWSELGGIPDDEEPAWGQWVPDHGKFNVLVGNTLVHHYSFFVQQAVLDRSPLLEEIRAANLPSRHRVPFSRHIPRAGRTLKQIVEIARRRITKAS